MSRLSSLLRQVEQNDPQLAVDLAGEVKALSGRRQFGLNFERHIPETVELYGRPVRKGDKVRFLAPRSEPPKVTDPNLWRVIEIARVDGARVARLMRADQPGTDPEAAERAVEDLVVVAEFRRPYLPGPVSTGTVGRGGDKPFHTVINAENFHALQHCSSRTRAESTAIYIDPPYNTGARDWKYNNDYVDGDDAYRHSQWLAFMERRLKLARRLLNPHDSVSDRHDRRARSLTARTATRTGLRWPRQTACHDRYESCRVSPPRTFHARRRICVRRFHW